MKVKTNLFLTASAILLLVGCGVTTQDQGLGDAANNVSGVAIDGYVMKATVYVDTNENNMLDIWEPRAITDKSGYFTYNPVTDVKYCERPLAAGELVHPNCLKMPAGYSEVLIRITGGYDIATSEPFTGTLSLRVSTQSQRLTVPAIATPITSLIALMSETQKTNFYSMETGVDQNNAVLDFLNFDVPAISPATTAERRALLALALKIHKVADTVGGILDKEFDQGLLDGLETTEAKGGFFGIESNIPTDASVYMYQAIAGEVSEVRSVSNLLLDVDLLAGIISSAYAKMRGVVSDQNAIQDAQYAQPETDGAVFATMATDLVSFVTMINDVLDEDSDVEAADELKARMRAIDVVASMMRSQQASDVVARAIDLAKDNAYIVNLKHGAVNISALKSRFIEQAGDAAGLAALDASIADFSGRSSLNDMFGQNNSGFSGSTTPGFDGKALNMGEGDKSVGITFAGDAVAEGGEAATTGTMTIDATFLGDEFASNKKDENGVDVVDENGDPVKEPLALEGTWEQIDDYTMLMNVEIAGATQPVIVKPTTTKDANGNEVAAYYFDFGGEQQIWIP